MKQIIRSNAVETTNQRDILEIKISDSSSRQVSIEESPVLSPTVTLSVLAKSSDIAIKNTGNRLTSFPRELLSALLYLVWWSKLDFLPVVVWVCTGKILQISHTQGKQITSGISETSAKTQTLGVMIARAEQAASRVLALKVNLRKFLPNIQKTNTQLVAKISKTKTWLNGVQTQRKQQSRFRNSFIHWELREPLRT